MYRLIIKSNGKPFAYYEFKNITACIFKQEEIEYQFRGVDGITFSVERS